MVDQKFPLVITSGPKSPTHQEIYTNAAKVGVGPWDIRIIFGRVAITENNQQVMEDLATIVMSPQHAKVLVGHWAQAIKTYEDTFGAIPDLTAFAAAATAAAKAPAN